MATTTIITDDNIRTYVKQFTENQLNRLPADLRSIPIGQWDVSRVTNMFYLFKECNTFNEPLDNWDVSNVTDMSNMFENCHEFNQPLNNWNVSNVTEMTGMFYKCLEFNQPLNNWNVSNVTDMIQMFSGSTTFNQPLNNWNVSNVTNMNNMFNQCTAFNQPLNNWNVSNVTDMNNMFYECTAFNQPLNNWNVSSVNEMTRMFYGCDTFNQSLNEWNISMSDEDRVEDIFKNCGIEEQNIRRIPLFLDEFQRIHEEDSDDDDDDDGDGDDGMITPRQAVPSPQQPSTRQPVQQSQQSQGELTLDQLRQHSKQPLKEIQALQLQAYDEDVRIAKNDTAYDLEIAEEVTLREETTFIKAYLSDTDNLLFKQDNKFYLVKKSWLKDQMNLTSKQNGIVFICKKEGLALDISTDLLKSTTPYLRMKTVGLYGFALASQIKSIISNTNMNQVYVLTNTKEDAPTVVSWENYYYKTGSSLVSGSHCQKDQGGSVYDIKVGNLNYEDEDSFFGSGGGTRRRMKGNKRKTTKRHKKIKTYKKRKTIHKKVKRNKRKTHKK